MNYSHLDTNIYVYMVSNIDSLTRDVRAVLEDAEHLKYLSIVSLQELITAFRTKGLLSNLWKNESEMIEFILHDPSVVIDNIDEFVPGRGIFPGRPSKFCPRAWDKKYSWDDMCRLPDTARADSRR